MAMLVTQISPAVAALTWMSIEWTRFGKPSVLGFATGAIGGLAALVIGSLHLDRLPMALCYVKVLTGLPCPTCGSTRAVGRLRSSSTSRGPLR